MRIRHFTLTELFVVAIAVTILVVLLWPHQCVNRESARRTNCAGNLKQIGLGLLMYADENDGFFITTPNGNNFEPLNTLTILNNGRVYGCPSASQLKSSAANSNYNYEGSGIRDDDLPLPGSTEDAPRYRRIALDQSGDHPDDNWMNVLFVDGHVRGAKPDGSKTWNTYGKNGVVE